MASELSLPPASTVPQDFDQEGGIHLDRLFAALRRHVPLISGVTVLTAAGSVLLAITDNPTYRSSVELLTPPVTLETQIISGLNPEALSNQPDVVSVPIDETKLKILTSPRVMDPIVAELQKSYPDLTYKKVVNNLKFIPSDMGTTLTVQYQSDEPGRVTEVLEVIAAAYLRYSLEDRQNDISRGIDFVDEQLPVVRDRVESLEADLETLRQSANLIDPLVQGEQLSEQMAKFTAQKFDLWVEMEQTRKLYQELQRELAEGEELAATSVLLESDRYQALLNQLLEVDSQLASELSLYLENSPEIGVIQDQRANLQPLLVKEGIRVQEQVASYIRELEDRDQALSQTVEILNQRIKRLSTVARQYNSIQRDLEIATTNLNQFLTKREALRIDAAQRQTPWEILTQPSDPQVSSASAKRNLVLGTVLGLLLGSGLAILVDRMSGKIHTITELKEAARLPLLGNIPYSLLLENGQPLILPRNQLGEMGFDPGAFEPYPSQNGQTSTRFLEAFSVLATNIRLSNPDSPVKALTVSSAIPDAGKSTISFHLAHASAAIGQRTLLVDTDLRRPSLHRFCNVSNDQGLSNYATGEFDLDDILVRLPIDENLFLIPSGPVPPNPLKTLSSNRMANFFQEIFERFDTVIFDSPPLLGFADAFMVAEKSQRLLLTARLGQVKYSQLQSALDELYIAKIPVIGMVANASKQVSDESYSYYQYYRPYHQSLEEANERSGHPDNGSNSNGSNANEKAAWHKALLNPFSKRR
ncbi:polysaccharide biosynthesis tyrosine autokinase [Romeria aff. gracilis LEGE 07310]|uniref:non-specific protein-tyrosine kinase n=1 Tax=Vasconcelosia minhoensis LEGE 07310 TaxID=915328 RepID=A0A8J7DET1_9CYAN|nr:tyrosine-protein kinase domain-containing protein [Romeria gracilis]MBE9080048.1 polysaccharide biosynthesis tyrosine autokinase [Romeria aff. gracilis LEGE 07310]